MEKSVRNIKTTIALFTILCMMITLVPMNAFAVGTTTKVQSDISEHWAKETIQKWMDQGSIKGYEDGTFRPDNNISRAEFMSLVNEIFNFKTVGACDFSDVKTTDWFAGTVAKASAAGYITGYPDGTMKPGNPITREEVASIIANIKNLAANPDATHEFLDSGRLAWSKGAVGAIYAAGIMSGYPDQTFQGDNNLKRGEAIVALDKAIHYSSKDVAYTKAGTYGPSSGSDQIVENVTVFEQGTTIQNMVIAGNLIIDKQVGEGNVYLKNVTVKGETIIYGGGENSVIIIDSTLGKVTVYKENGKIRILISGSTTIQSITANSGVTLEEDNLNSGNEGFNEIILDAEDGDMIVLIGTFSEIEINSQGLEIQIPNKTVINTLILNEKTEITGTGIVQNAEINMSGITFETPPVIQNVAPGIIAPKISGNLPTNSEKRSSGPNRSNDEPDESVAVSTIMVTGTSTVLNGSTLQMTADLTPQNATNKTLTWSIVNGTGTATIDSLTGLLTATGVGTVTVEATNAASGVVGQLLITIELSLEEAKAEAVSAAITEINSADTSTMAMVITSNAVILGLNLTDYNTLSDLSSVIAAMVALDGADKDSILSIFNITVAEQKAADHLAAAKVAAKAEVEAAFLSYDSAQYTTENWTTLITAKIDSDVSIDGATDLTGIETAKAAALNAMDALKTLAEVAAEAEADAVAAINNADSTTMEMTIASNVGILGLTLTEYNTLSDLSSVIAALVALDGADKALIVSTFNTAVATQKTADHLAAAKLTAKAELTEAWSSYHIIDYSLGEWLTLTTAKMDGEVSIDGATDLTGVETAKETALNAMDAVKTMAEVAAEAEEAAVAAINNAESTTMEMTIVSNAAILGLNLTDYNTISSHSTVIAALVALDGADKASIVSTFNTAVAAQKTADHLNAAKVTAKAELTAAWSSYYIIDYSPEEWLTLSTAKMDGDVSIDGAVDLTGVETAKAAALNAMDAVKTIFELAAEAEATAVAAINNADSTTMEMTIVSNAAILGLNLTEYSTLSSHSSVIVALVALDGADKASIVSTFNTAVAAQKTADHLAAAKVTAKAELEAAFLSYDYTEYTIENWTILITAKTDGDSSIDGAIDLTGVETGKIVAFNAMDAVKTIAEVAAEAEAGAVAAINNADSTTMEMTIVSNAAILGLNLTEYNTLSSHSSVITAMVSLDGADKALIASTFETAVASQKAADSLEEASFAVANAESSNLQSDLDLAQVLVNGLPDGDNKIALQARIDIVQNNIYSAVDASLEAAKVAESLLNSYDYVDYSEVTAALAMAESTIAEKMAKTTAINETIAALELLTYIIDFDSSQLDHNFGNHISSYDGLGMSIVNYIVKKGSGDITNLTGNLSGSNPEAFTLALDSDSAWVTTLNADRYWNDFRVYPINGLASGSYSATVTFTADNGVSLSFNISFKVS